MPIKRAEFAEVVNAVRDHTALLLGTTIGYSDDDWAAPTRLAGWTRSHVAAHLAEGAYGMVRVIDGLQRNTPTTMYVSDEAEHRAIEVGALISGLDLQIRLDTTANALQHEFASLEDDQRLVTLRRGFDIAAEQLPLARLREVVLHHMDLGSQFTATHLASGIAVELLAFQLQIQPDSGRADLPATRIVAEEGFVGFVGAPGATAQVTGPAGDLVAWLARGTDSPRLQHS